MPNQHEVDTYPTFPVNHRYFLSLLNDMSLEPRQTLKSTVPGTSLKNSGDEDSEYRDEYSAQSWDSEKDFFLPRSPRSDE